MAKELIKDKRRNKIRPQNFWKLFKKSLIKRGIFEPNGRQPYTVGKLKAGVTIEDIKKRLNEFGFNKVKLEWQDLGQIFSARLKEGKQQYHLRIFKDREVRGHIELRPKHIIKHLRAKTRKSCFAFFLVLLLEFLE